MTQHDLTLVPGGHSAEAVTEVLDLKHMIDGSWMASASGDTFERVSPATGQLVSRAARGGETETDAAIAAARRAFDDRCWSDMPGAERAKMLNKVADLIDDN